MKKELVFISHSHLTQKYFDSHAIGILSKDYRFSYWDAVAVFRSPYEDNHQLNEDFVVFFDDYNELKQNIEEISSETIVISDMPFNYTFIYFFRALKHFKGLFLHLDSVTTGPYQVKRKEHPAKRFIRLTIKMSATLNLLKEKIHMELLKFNNSLRNYDYCFTRGEALFKNNPNRNIAINSPDYDEYLKDQIQLNDNKVRDKRPSAVFLDVYLPFHPDLPLMGLPFIDDPELYFSTMNSLFDQIEKKYNLEVLIAAHPSALYRGHEFGGRPIVHGESRSLVKNSKLVISHHSNSIAYAILYKKPILFCYTDEMHNLYQDSHLRHQGAYAQVLQSKTYNISGINIKDLPDITQEPNYDLYSNFISNYLCCKSTKERHSHETIKEFLQQKSK